MDRGGTSIDELMRQPNNSNISEDESMVQSILEEINQDKEQQINMQQQQNVQQQQNLQQQQMIENQKMMEKQMYEKKQQEMMMMKQRQQMMEKQRMIQQNQKINNNEKNMCENISLLDEFKSTIIFFSIFILINITQFNSLICGALSIENNNIFILLKGFIATVIFFFVNKLVNKYI